MSESEASSGDRATIDVPALKRLADIAGSAVHLGLMAEAETISRAITSFCPAGSTGPLIGLAMARYGQGDVEEAVTILRDEALAIEPGCPDLSAHLGLILRAEGRYREAEECMSGAFEQAMDDATRELVDKVTSGRFDSTGTRFGAGA